MRPSSRIARMLPKPLPGAPSSCAFGTRHPSSTSPWVSLACRPSLLRRLDNEAGCVGFDDERRDAVVSAGGDGDDAGGLVPERAMNACDPLITQSSPSWVARAHVAPASLPASAWVRPKARRGLRATRSGTVDDHDAGVVRLRRQIDADDSHAPRLRPASGLTGTNQVRCISDPKSPSSYVQGHGRQNDFDR